MYSCTVQYVRLERHYSVFHGSFLSSITQVKTGLGYAHSKENPYRRKRSKERITVTLSGSSFLSDFSWVGGKLTGIFFGFLYALYSTLLYLRPLRFHCFRRMLGSNAGLWLWQSEALSTRLDLNHSRLDLILNSARSHPHSATDLIPHSARSHPHPAVDLIHNSAIDLIHARLDFIHNSARSHPQLGLDLIHTRL
jgi:hypothetical protein